MKVDGRHFRSIWLEQDGWSVGAVDQRRLPHDFIIARIASCEDAADAIRSMLVRGAPLIGATAAYGIALAMRVDGSDAALDRAYNTLIATRPTAINLKWALEEMRSLLRPLSSPDRTAAAYSRAAQIAEEDIAINKSIGEHGVALIEAIKATKRPGERVNVLTHCNAGWLAVVDLGTATTFDCITADGVFLGGAIAPGVQTSAETLTRRTSKLPATELTVPPRAIGKRTEDCIRAGVIFGAADAIDGMVRRIKKEWPHSTTPLVIATGGFAEMFGGLCKEFDKVVPFLTLQGLQIAHALLLPAPTNGLDQGHRPKKGMAK